MPCTTLLVGKKASYDGSTMTARNEDSPAGMFTPKKFTVLHPEEIRNPYRSVLSHVEIELPDNPMRCTIMPDALGDKGIWAAAGVNEANVSMTATETLTTNERVLAADPLVKLVKAHDGKPEIPGGIGEEDIVYLTLPYIHSAREGVERLGLLHEKYGTYEMNGIAFQDVDEIWWFETIGGHHWIARRVPDDAYVVMPNQLGIDWFDLEDAYGEQKNFMCSMDLKEFIAEHHLDLSLDGKLNPRDAFGSHSDSDHVYNTPRAWYMLKYFNPHTTGDNPHADDLPWCRVPEKKITVEDAKYILSSHYQGTPYDPYARYGDLSLKGSIRPIGINRNNFLSLVQIRPDRKEDRRAIEWIAFSSNPFNAFIPMYANIEKTPEYFANTAEHADTRSFYWINRIIAALADSNYSNTIPLIERYQQSVQSRAFHIIETYDEKECDERTACNEAANAEIEALTREATQKLLDEVLCIVSNNMKNGFSRSDA